MPHVTREDTDGTILPKKRPAESKAIDLAQLPRLIRRGWTKQMIAEKFKLSTAQVQIDVQLVLQELRVARDKDMEALVMAKMEELAEVKREAWLMWEATKKPVKKKVVEQTSDPNALCPMCSGTGANQSGAECFNCAGTGTRGNKIKRVKEVKDQRGHVEYLQIILKCIEMECKLQALFPMKGVSVSLTGSATTINWDLLAKSVPDNGEVPDDIEAELERAVYEIGVQHFGEEESDDVSVGEG
jgi:RecJ-like exonuclease